MGLTPSSGSQSASTANASPVISRELLRSVCEPFFEQMLTALENALREQQKLAQMTQTSTSVVEPVMHSTYHSAFPAEPMSVYHSTQLPPMDDEESTEEPEEHGAAFATLLSGSSSPSQVEVADVAQEVAQAALDDSDQASDPEKAVMVCRHWRSKGWCRLEGNCKFLHPESKRGIAAPGDLPLADGDIVAATAKRKRRGGKGRSLKSQMTAEQDPSFQTHFQVLGGPTLCDFSSGAWPQLA